MANILHLQKQCPQWDFEKQVIERKIKNNLLFPEARAQIISENPQLVARISSLKTISPWIVLISQKKFANTGRVSSYDEI